MKIIIDSNRLQKQEYIKPVMQIVKIQSLQMLCASDPFDQSNMALHSDIIDDENDVW